MGSFCCKKSVEKQKDYSTEREEENEYQRQVVALKEAQEYARSHKLGERDMIVRYEGVLFAYELGGAINKRLIEVKNGHVISLRDDLEENRKLSRKSRR